MDIIRNMKQEDENLILKIPNLYIAKDEYYTENRLSTHILFSIEINHNDCEVALQEDMKK